MKEIVAFIKPHRLPEMTLALQKIKGLRGTSVTEVKGFGRREEPDTIYSVDDLMDFAPYTRIEIFCIDEIVDELVSVIDKTAHTGLRGDGKIYVLDVETAYKIGKGKIG
ncbi:MAG: P-II family nitrogen regulator [Thermodesulfovibrionales bacterium]|nr:P-II family nitrogen regulator [Thermodesulfovibrionales bacterium]